MRVNRGESPAKAWVEEEEEKKKDMAVVKVLEDFTIVMNASDPGPPSYVSIELR